MTKTELYISLILNGIIFIMTSIIVTRFFTVPKESGRLTGIHSFRYYTSLSNAISGVACALVFFHELAYLFKGASDDLSYTYPHWLQMFKYMSTGMITITFLTVIFFLGPTQGYGTMYKGRGFYNHLIGPICAIVSFCFLEDFGRISYEEVFVGIMPTLVYGLVYLRQVVFAQEIDPDGSIIKGWPDYYGFNRNGKWMLSFLAMLIAAIVICLLIRFIYNM